jgi:excisionase family DNA binding protein
MSTWDDGQQEDGSRSGLRLRLAQRGQHEDSPPLSDIRFLTVAEIALIMRVSKMTVYRLVHSRELESARVGRSFRVPEEAVNQYLRAAFAGTAS